MQGQVFPTQFIPLHFLSGPLAFELETLGVMA